MSEIDWVKVQEHLRTMSNHYEIGQNSPWENTKLPPIDATAGRVLGALADAIHSGRR